MTEQRGSSTPQDSQRAPEEFVTENELICEKLLSWGKIRPQPPLEGIDFVGWRRPSGGEQLSTPSFATWAEAGLILEALREKAVVTMHQLRDGVPQRCTIVVGFSVQDEGLRKGAGVTLPLAIRAAALEYIKAVKS